MRARVRFRFRVRVRVRPSFGRESGLEIGYCFVVRERVRVKVTKTKPPYPVFSFVSCRIVLCLVLSYVPLCVLLEECCLSM